MKELVKVTPAADGQAHVSTRDMLLAAALHVTAAVCGLLLSRTTVAQRICPFGLSLVASCPQSFVPAAALGAFAGYFFPAVGGGGFRYLAALFSLLTVRILLGEERKLAKNPVFLSGCCLGLCLFTSLLTVRAADDLPILLGEGLLAGGACYCLCRCFRALERPETGLSPEELSALLIGANLLLMGLQRLRPAGLSVGRILSFFLILGCAKYGGSIAGAASGIAAAFGMLLCGTADGIAASCAFAGLLAAIFAPYGRYIQVGAFLLTVVTAAAILGTNESSVLLMIESLLGCALFLVLPRQAGVIFSRIFTVGPRISVSSGMKKALTMRLTLAAGALDDVSKTVEQVSHELSRINAPDFSGVISGVEQDGCAGCKLRLHCWESRREATVAAVFEMTRAVKDGAEHPEAAAPEEFRGRCLRPERVGAAVGKNYGAYAAQTAAENRLEEVRSVVSDQFDGISVMLEQMARDFDREESFDNRLALAAAAALKELNLLTEECSCHVDRGGRMTLEFKLKRHKDLVLNKRQVMKLLSNVCEREMDVPTVSEVGGSVFLTVSEHASLRVSFGVEQSCASGSTLCGDAYQFFNDGRGHFIMILSDGMGTGGRAAVDGAMASGLMSRLLRAGFGYDCSLRILNSSMLFKSTDESLATVDIASIDLYRGVAELYKAGAAPTLVRRSGRIGRAESTSLPAGILREIGFDKAAVKLREGDILLMLSDGAIGEGIDWISAELEAWQDGDAQSLAEHICEYARRRRSDGHEDDITVMAAIVERENR